MPWWYTGSNRNALCVFVRLRVCRSVVVSCMACTCLPARMSAMRVFLKVEKRELKMQPARTTISFVRGIHTSCELMFGLYPIRTPTSEYPCLFLVPTSAKFFKYAVENSGTGKSDKV